MRLIDLEPKWLTPDMFAFRCPCGHKNWLTCKTKPMGSKEQYAILEAAFGEDWNLMSVATKPSFGWTIKDGNRDFDTMTVTPSIDASNSGGCTWHGFITSGVIT